MSSRAVAIRWSFIGAAVASIFIAAQAMAVGGITGLLQVGEESSLRPLIESELGEIPLAPGRGHDGQIYYAIGLDLDGDEVGPLLDHAGYRYRRILYPLAASFGGLADGYVLLHSMVGLSVLSVAAAAGATAWTAVRLGGPAWLALSVLANPGVWLSARLLTADNLALALMALGLAALDARRQLSTTSFLMSGLAKDVSVLTPSALIRRRRLALGFVPIAGLALWSLWVTVMLGEGFSPRGNLGLPFVGLLEASAVWPENDPIDLVYLGVAMITVAVGLLAGIRWRTSWLRWPIVAWSLVAVFSTDWVWRFGNNAMRAFAPILVLLALGFLRPGDLASD